MNTFLLTWSPLLFAWEDLPAMARKVRRGSRVTDRWSCARGKQIREGDRLFMLRQGKEPRGLFASGHATSDWYEDANWRGPGYCHYIDLCYDVLSPHVLLPREALVSGKLAAMQWDTRVSGIRIPGAIARELENKWGHLELFSRAGNPRRPRR